MHSVKNVAMKARIAIITVALGSIAMVKNPQNKAVKNEIAANVLPRVVI
jgi:hypothetical protein